MAAHRGRPRPRRRRRRGARRRTAGRCGSSSRQRGRRAPEPARRGPPRARSGPAGYADLSTATPASRQRVRRRKRDAARRSSSTRAGPGSPSPATARPARATRSSTTAGSGPTSLDYTVDRNPYKHGRFTPGTHIPILAPERLAETRPDVILILPWNLRDEIAAPARLHAGVGGAARRRRSPRRSRSPEPPMKVVLFCGGRGLRLREHCEAIPKPMVQIGYRPILWHVMRYYAHYGHRDFILCLGYRADAIKDYFLHYERGGLQRLRPVRGRPPDRAAGLGHRGLADHLRRHRPRHDHRRAAAPGPPPARGRGDLPGQLRRHPHRRPARPAGRARSGPTRRRRPSSSVRPSLLVPRRRHGPTAGGSTALRDVASADLRINGGGYLFRREILDGSSSGEDLVDAPFAALAAEGRLAAYRYDGFWVSLDTLKDLELPAAARGAGLRRRGRSGAAERCEELTRRPQPGPPEAAQLPTWNSVRRDRDRVESRGFLTRDANRRACPDHRDRSEGRTKRVAIFGREPAAAMRALPP